MKETGIAKNNLNFGEPPKQNDESNLNSETLPKIHEEEKTNKSRTNTKRSVGRQNEELQLNMRKIYDLETLDNDKMFNFDKEFNASSSIAFLLKSKNPLIPNLIK